MVALPAGLCLCLAGRACEGSLARYVFPEGALGLRSGCGYGECWAGRNWVAVMLECW